MQEKRSSRFPTRTDTNWPLQLPKKARNLKYQIPCSENNGADQLCNYCTADLCICFRIGKNLLFSLYVSF